MSNFPNVHPISPEKSPLFLLGGLGQGHPPPRRRPRQPRPGRRLRRPGALARGLGAAAGGAGEVGQRGGTRGSGAWDPTGTPVVLPKKTLKNPKKPLNKLANGWLFHCDSLQIWR